jgi:hypothetical protein
MPLRYGLKDKIAFYWTILFQKSSSSGYPDRKCSRETLAAMSRGAADSCDTLIFKIDIEGVEEEVLGGTERILNSGKDIHLLIEDFVNPAIISFFSKIQAWSLCVN